MNLSDAINELGHSIGLPNLQLSDAGTCRLNFDKSLTVDFESTQGGRGLHLCSYIGQARQLSSNTLAELLRANTLGGSTGGATFSMSPAGEVLLECYLNVDTMDFTELTLAVECFVNHLEGWKGILPASIENTKLPA